MSNTVTVACSHPQGFVCELGLVLDYAAQRFVKTPAYRRVQLRGSQRSTIIRLGGPENFKATRGLEPGRCPNHYAPGSTTAL